MREEVARVERVARRESERGDREDDGRKIVANDGEVKAASSSFSLSAFVLLGVSTTRPGEILVSRREWREEKRISREKSFVLLKALEKLIKMKEVATMRYERHVSFLIIIRFAQWM